MWLNDANFIYYVPSIGTASSAGPSLYLPSGQSLSLGHANIINGKYKYLADLQSMEACRAPVPPLLPDTCKGVTCPLHLQAWRSYLAYHPDHCFATYLLNGISQGFRIGFSYLSELTPTMHNMLSTRENGHVVDDYIKEELQAGRLILIPQKVSIPGLAFLGDSQKRPTNQMALDCGPIIP
jgi:hypothetical protein